MPGGFHRIRHYGLFANGTRADNIAQARKLLNVPASQTQSGDTNAPKADEPPALAQQRIMSQKLNAAIAVARNRYRQELVSRSRESAVLARDHDLGQPPPEGLSHVARFSAPWFHPVYTAHAASSPDWLRAQRPCLENPSVGHTWPPPRARVDTVQNDSQETVVSTIATCSRTH